jgi:hypothetical protein
LRDIRISRKYMIMLAGIVLVTILGILAINFLVIHPAQAVPTPSVGDAQASAAATAGTEAFFNINYEQGKETWLKGICAVSSESGCQYFTSGSDLLWKRFADFQTVTQGKAQLLSKARSTDSEQVWQISVTLSQPLPGSEKTSDEAYVLVVRVNDDWKFDRFLTEKEIQAIKKGSAQSKSNE